MIVIEIIVPLSHVGEVKPILETCCREVGDILLGSHESQDVQQGVFLVQLTHDTHSSQHIDLLHKALQQQAISSFRFVHGSLLRLCSPHIVTQIEGLPLIAGDIWVAAFDNPECFYLSIPRLLMSGKQSAWLLSHEDIEWRYL